MQTYQLRGHPAHPPSRVSAVEARVIGRTADWTRLRWRIEGSDAIVVPPFAGKGRADGLWKTTCFEAFLLLENGPAYLELNLSPSERWNAYRFDRIRTGMAEWPLAREPECTMRLGSRFAIFDAAIPGAALPATGAALGLTAVIEEEGGVISYWALDHGDPARPDFHDPSCFTARLEAPAAA